MQTEIILGLKVTFWWCHVILEVNIPTTTSQRDWKSLAKKNHYIFRSRKISLYIEILSTAGEPLNTLDRSSFLISPFLSLRSVFPHLARLTIWMVNSVLSVASEAIRHISFSTVPKPYLYHLFLMAFLYLVVFPVYIPLHQRENVSCWCYINFSRKLKKKIHR